MRLCVMGCLAFVSAAIGVLPASGAAGDGEAAEWLQWHFLGSTRIAAETNGVRARAVFEQPTTRTLVERAMAGLVRASTSQEGTNAALVRAVFDEVARAESYGSLRTDGGLAGLEWQVALRVGPERAEDWGAKWEALAGATGFAVARSAVVADWFVGGLKRSGALDLQPLRARVGPDAPSGEGRAWLELTADLTALSGALGWPKLPVFEWPRVHLTLAGRGDDLRTTAGFEFPSSLDLRLGEWRLPTNSVRDPLLSFSALQGVEPWLAGEGTLQELGWPAPNQIFVWAQSLTAYATHVTWEMPEAATRIPAAQAKVRPVIARRLPWADLGVVEYVPEITRLAWRGFPILVPFANPAADAGFATGGVFPVANPTEPAPDELFAQIRGRTNLVYYGWELTQPRLGDWRELEMLRKMVIGHVPPATNSVAWAWLRDTNVTAHLGNCVTEVTAASPRELHVVRNSAIGLTAFESLRAALWIEGDRFPRHTPPELLQFQRKTTVQTNAPPVTP